MAKSPLLKKGDAPSRKKSKGYYNKANDSGTGAEAGGGMSEKGVAKYRKDNPGSKLYYSNLLIFYAKVHLPFLKEVI